LEEGRELVNPVLATPPAPAAAKSRETEESRRRSSRPSIMGAGWRLNFLARDFDISTHLRVTKGLS
jgi:hypothetical protein